MLRIYKPLFSEDILSPITGYKVQLQIRGDAPIFRLYYNIPIDLQERVKQQYKKLHKSGIIEPIEHTYSATPLVIISKSDGELHLCLDL